MSPPGDRAAKLALRAFYFAAFFAFGVVLPYFPRWLEARGVTGFAMGAVMATLPVMGLVGPPLFGVLADSLQLRRSLLGLACGGAAATFAAIAWLAGRETLGFGLLLVMVGVFAFFRSPIILLADVIALEEVGGQSARYGAIRVWGSLGFLVAALVVGRSVELGGSAAWPAAVACSLGVAFLVSLLLPARGALPPRPAVGRARALLADGRFRLLLVGTFSGYLGQSAYDLTYSLHLRDLGLSTADVGLAWGIGVVAEIGLMAASTRIFARSSPAPLLVIAWASAAARFALVALVRDPRLQLALQPSHAVAFALFWIAAIEYNKRRVSDDLRGSALGLFMAAISAGSVVGMLVWGAVYERAGGTVTFACAAACSAVAAGVGVALARRTRGEPAPVTPDPSAARTAP